MAERSFLFTKAGGLEIQLWLEEFDSWVVKCSLSLSSPLSSRFFLFFFGAFFGPCVPIALKKKATLCTPAKNDIEIRFPYSTDRFVIRIHNWHFNSFWIQTLQRLVASVLHTSLHAFCRPSSILHVHLQVTTLHLSTTIGLK